MDERQPDFIIGGTGFLADRRIIEEGFKPVREIYESLMVPRNQIAGEPGAENLARDEWLWTVTNFSGGEGRLVFNPADHDKGFFLPSYRDSTGGLDTRLPGEVSLSLAAAAVTTVDVGAVTDTRHVFVGYDGNVYALHWDGTNIDVYKWDFASSDWDSVQANAINSLPVATAASDSFNYTLCANGIIYRWTTGAWTAYTAAGTGTPAGLVVSNNRLYALFFGATRFLYEIVLDGTAVPYSENTDDYVRVMTAADFPTEESHDQTLRSYITAIPSGVRFITNAQGGTTEIYEFSDGAGYPVGTMLKGVDAHSIHHYQGTTYIGAQFAAQGSGTKRSAIFYMRGYDEPQMLTYLRYHDPDDEKVVDIQSHGHNVYCLQGKYLFRYDTNTGGVTLDTQFAPTTDSNAKALAVLDTKKWAAYQGEGPHVTGTTYPNNSTKYVRLPIWNYGVPDKDKTLLEVILVTEPLPAATSVSVDYQDNEDGVWTTMTAPASASLDGATTHIFKAWGTAASPTTVQFRNIEFRVGLLSENGTSTPTLRSFSAKAYVLDYQQAFELAIDLRDGDVLGDGYSPEDRADLLRTLITNKALVSFTNNYDRSTERPDPDTYATIIEDPYKDLESPGRGRCRVRLKVLG